MRIPKRGRSSLREWWPELLAGAILAAVAFAHTGGAAFLAAFCAVILAVGWALGHRHRRLPMQATLEGVRQDVGEIRETMHAAVEALTEPAPPGPAAKLRLHKGGRA